MRHLCAILAICGWLHHFIIKVRDASEMREGGLFFICSRFCLLIWYLMLIFYRIIHDIRTCRNHVACLHHGNSWSLCLALTWIGMDIWIIFIFASFADLTWSFWNFANVENEGIADIACEWIRCFFSRHTNVKWSLTALLLHTTLIRILLIWFLFRVMISTFNHFQRCLRQWYL